VRLPVHISKRPRQTPEVRDVLPGAPGSPLLTREPLDEFELLW
jgi:hypothetical protein